MGDAAETRRPHEYGHTSDTYGRYRTAAMIAACLIETQLGLNSLYMSEMRLEPASL